MAPKINLDIGQLARAMNRGGAMGGPTMPNAYGSERDMSPGSPASGGSTAGTGANPSRTGPISPRGVGSSMVPNASPHMHALTRASLTHLASIGHPHQNHHAIMKATGGHLAAAKRTAKAPARPRAQAPSFGSLADTGGGIVGNPSRGGGPSMVPGANPTRTIGGPFVQDQD